jgi:hypothetical protein
MPRYEVSRAGSKLGEVAAADEQEAAKIAEIKYGPRKETLQVSKLKEAWEGTSRTESKMDVDPTDTSIGTEQSPPKKSK